MLRTTVKGYSSPCNEEIRSVAREIGFDKKYSPDLVRDIANLVSGGGVLPPSEIKTAARAAVKVDRLDDDGYNYRYNGRTLYDSDGYQVGLKKGMLAAVDAAANIPYHQRVAEFLSSLEIPFGEGTPIEMALSVVKALSEMDGGQTEGEGDDSALPIFTHSKDSPREASSRIKEALDQAKSLDPETKELLNFEEKESLEIAPDLIGDKGIFDRIARQLDKLSKFKTSKTMQFEPNPDGSEIRMRQMKSPSEIGRMSPVEWVYPARYRNYRIATLAPSIRERVERIERKQYIKLLIDCSGSMSEDKRYAVAGGVLLNRLKAVLSGEVEMTFHFFDNGLYKSVDVTDMASAKEAMSRIRENNFSGGGTQIDDCIRQAVKEVIDHLENRDDLTKPEIVIVTDGDDSVGLLPADLQGVKLHSFLVGGCKNERLSELARKSGGIGINL